MIRHYRLLHGLEVTEEATALTVFQVYDILYIITVWYKLYYTVSCILYLDMNAQQRLKYEQATERHNKRMANKTANDMDWKWFMKPFTMFEHVYTSLCESLSRTVMSSLSLDS